MSSTTPDASTLVAEEHSESTRPSRNQLRWINEMEVVFIAFMKDMQLRSTKSAPSGFTKDAYKRVAERMKEVCVQPELCDETRMKNKLGSLRNDWRTWVNLLNTGWKLLPNGCPTNSDDVLERYYRDTDHNARKFKTTPLKHFTELTDLFDPKRKEWIDLATGKHAKGIHDVLAELRGGDSTPRRFQRPLSRQSAVTQPESAPLPHSPYEPQAQTPTQQPDLGGNQEVLVSEPQELSPNHAVEYEPAAPETDASDASRKRPGEALEAEQPKRPSHAAVSTTQQTTQPMPQPIAQPFPLYQTQHMAYHAAQPPQSQAPDHMGGGYFMPTSQLSPVAAATSLFTRNYQSLAVHARVAVLEHFKDQNMAEIFLHTDLETRDALVQKWVRQSGAC